MTLIEFTHSSSSEIVKKNLVKKCNYRGPDEKKNKNLINLSFQFEHETKYN